MCPEAVSLLEGSCLNAAALPLKPDVLHTLDSLQTDSLYAFYHRQWWCFSHMYRVFKFRQALLNGVALLVVAAGMIAGSIFENTIVASCLAFWGSVIKGWNNFKKFPIKVDRCQFAYTTYAKILTELRTYTRGISFDECCECRRQLGRSFIYKGNQRGPRIVTCGTPQRRNILDDLFPFTKHVWVRFFK